MTRFATVWVGQLVSVIGSSLTGFVLAVWVYQLTGSATQMAIVFAANTLPGLLFGPIAGVVADRWDRKAVLLTADGLAALTTLAVALLLWADALAVWHVYLTTAIGAAAKMFHAMATAAITPKLVPKRHLGRANGLMQVNFAATVAAPVLAGTLMTVLGATGVVLLDLATFVVAVATLLLARLPREITHPDPRPADAPRTSFLGDLVDGWRYLLTVPALLLLISFSALHDLLFGMTAVLVRPLILGFSSPAMLGLLEFLGGAGLFVGSLVMTVWGGPKRRVRAILVITALSGVALALHSLSPSPWLIAVVAPAFLVTVPLVSGSVMTVVQLKAEPRMLGRTVAALRTAWQAALPVGGLLAGVLAERALEPAMLPGGALAAVFGPVIGTGTGRGTALLFVFVGALMLLLAAAGAAVPRLRRLERDLPDAVSEPTMATATQGAKDAAES